MPEQTATKIHIEFSDGRPRYIPLYRARQERIWDLLLPEAMQPSRVYRRPLFSAQENRKQTRKSHYSP